MEGLLQHENFVIGRPSGYGVTSGKSTGLEPANVESWLGKTFTVFFASKEDCDTSRAQTVTEFKDSLKLLFLDIVLESKKSYKPSISCGVLFDLKSKKPDNVKFEQAMNHVFFYNRDKIVIAGDDLTYNDSYLSFQGKVMTLPLFTVQSSEDVEQKIVQPMLTAYRGIAQ